MPSRSTTEIMGHLGRDPETRHTNSGSPVTSFSIAVSNDYKNKSGEWVEKDATWYNCQLWGSLGEQFAERFSKGSLVMVRGKIDLRKYTTQSGEERSSLDLKVFEVYEPVRERKDKGGTDEDERPRRKQSRQDDDFPADVEDSDIPF